MSTSELSDFRIKCLTILLIACICYVVWHSATILMLLMLSVCFAVVLYWFRTLITTYTPVPDSVAFLITVVATLSLYALTLWAFLPAFSDQLKLLADKMPEYRNELIVILKQVDVGRYLVNELEDPETLLSSMRSNLDDVFDKVVGIFSDLLVVISSILLITVVGFYLARSPQFYVNSFLRLIPKPYRSETHEILEKIGSRLRYWLLGQSISMLFLGTATTIALSLMGVPFALLLGSFTAVMTFVPNFGPIVAAIPIFLVTMLSAPEKILSVSIFYIILQNLEGFIITPQIQQRAIRVPAVFLLAAQLILVNLWGVLGIIVAFPLIVCLSIIVSRFYVIKFLDDDLQKPALKRLATD